MDLLWNYMWKLSTKKWSELKIEVTKAKLEWWIRLAKIVYGPLKRLRQMREYNRGKCRKNYVYRWGWNNAEMETILWRTDKMRSKYSRRTRGGEGDIHEMKLIQKEKVIEETY